MTKRFDKDNACGYLAILLWSFGALFTVWTPQIPPLMVAGLASTAGVVFYTLFWILNPQKFRAVLHQPWQVWLLFFTAAVLYRGFYFTGLKLAPVVEANLLNYLWPLLIVLLPALMERKKLSVNIILGALCCFVGVICIGLSKKGGFSFEWGHILAIAAAFFQAIYSVAARRFPNAPSDTIGLMHVVAAVLFLSLHSVFEQPVDFATINWLNWVGVAGLGLAASLGYSLWVRAMTHGEREKVAVAAYYTPLLSTLWLILFSNSHLNFFVWLGAGFILGGSMYARLTAKPEAVAHVIDPLD